MEPYRQIPEEFGGKDSDDKEFLMGGRPVYRYFKDKFVLLDMFLIDGLSEKLAYSFRCVAKMTDE